VRTYHTKMRGLCQTAKTLRSFRIRLGVRDGKMRSSFCDACEKKRKDNPDWGRS
jgi:hypothetical protein